MSTKTLLSLKVLKTIRERSSKVEIRPVPECTTKGPRHRAFKKELVASSLHAQAQAPDDPFHDQDSQYVSCDSLCRLHHVFNVSNRLVRIDSVCPFQDYPRSVPFISFYFNTCLKITRLYPPDAYRKHLRDFYLRAAISDSIVFLLDSLEQLKLKRI
jgi:hypothetical protein